MNALCLAPSRLARVLVNTFLPLARTCLITQHIRQVIDARQCGWMFFTQHRLPQPVLRSQSRANSRGVIILG
jgi:hypothetical protein